MKKWNAEPTCLPETIDTELKKFAERRITMETTNLEIIDRLLSWDKSIEPHTHPDFGAFWQNFTDAAGGWEAPVDRAVFGGVLANCFAYAFAAGYCCALQRLIPGLPRDTVACFCITEAGGGHPRAIQSRLAHLGAAANQECAFTLNGKKKYITCAAEADLFLVAASDGIRDDGRNSIRMIKVDAGAPGICIQPMHDIRLVPEISHASVAFADVPVSGADLLPGDGYTDYIKPFRTVEDLHVSAAVLGYLFKAACTYNWGRDVLESILGCIVPVRSLALSRPDAPAAHIVMADALKKVKALFQRLDPLWETAGGDAKQAWDRDKALMDIADKARAMRLQTAWKYYSALSD